MKYITLPLVFYLSIQIGLAQDLSWVNHSIVNPYVNNPSLVDLENQPSVFLLRRQQWSGIDGAPITNYVSLQSSFGKHVLFGANIVNDTRALLSTTSAMLTGGYSLHLSEEQRINFAISAGVGINNVDLSSIEYDYLDSSDDPVLSNGVDKGTFLNGNAGISYSDRRFYFGIALPQIFDNKLLNSNAFEMGEFSPMNRVNIMSSITLYDLEEKIGIQPFLAYHYSKFSPNYFEAALLGHFYKYLTLGASYRHNASISGILGLNIKDHVRIGYSYEANTNVSSELLASSNGTHEFSLRILFGKKKLPTPKATKNRRNFQKSSSSSAKTETKKENVDPSVSAFSTGAFANTKQKNNVSYTSLDSAKLGFTSSAFEEISSPSKSYKKPQKQRKIKNHTKAKISYQDSKPKVQSDEHAVFVTTPTPVQNQVAPIEEPLEAKDAKPRFDYRKDDVFDETGKYVGPTALQKGNHLLELNKGYYVVIGAFKEYRAAEELSDKLFDQGFYAKYGYTSQTDIYFVYSFHTANKETAVKEVNRLKTNSSRFRDVWILTIE